MNEINALTEAEAKLLLKKSLDFLGKSLDDLREFEKSTLYDVKCIFRHLKNGGYTLESFYYRVLQEKLSYYCNGYTSIHEFISHKHFIDCFNIVESLYEGNLDEILRENSVGKSLLLKYMVSNRIDIDFSEVENATKESIITMNDKQYSEEENDDFNDEEEDNKNNKEEEDNDEDN